MLFLSDRMTSASGSIGGTTFAHNRYGMYTRARRVPVNPNTPAQQAQRSALATAAAAWRAITSEQRTEWAAYAGATTELNALGSSVTLPGSGQFVASNSLLIRFGFPAVSAGPTLPGKIPLGSPTVTIDASAFTIIVASLSFESDLSELGVFLGSPQSAGVAFFAGPYQLRGHDQIAAETVTITAAAGRNGLAFVAGQRLPWRLAGIDTTTGRLTTIASGITLVVA